MGMVEEFAGKGASSEVKDFLSVFLKLAYRSDESKKARQIEWPNIDTGRNGLLSLGMVKRWIQRLLVGGKGQKRGMFLYRLFSPMYIRAFNAALEVPDAPATDYVTRSQFRLLIAYLCVFALALDAFETIQLSSSCDDRSIDSHYESHFEHRMTREEWITGCKKAVNHGFIALSEAVARAHNDRYALERVFNLIDENGGGMVLLPEWCNFLRTTEIEGDTYIGSLIAIGKGGVADTPDKKHSEFALSTEMEELAVTQGLFPSASSAEEDMAKPRNIGLDKVELALETVTELTPDPDVSVETVKELTPDPNRKVLATHAEGAQPRSDGQGIEVAVVDAGNQAIDTNPALEVKQSDDTSGPLAKLEDLPTNVETDPTILTSTDDVVGVGADADFIASYNQSQSKNAEDTVVESIEPDIVEQPSMSKVKGTAEDSKKLGGAVESMDATGVSQNRNVEADASGQAGALKHLQPLGPTNESQEATAGIDLPIGSTSEQTAQNASPQVFERDPAQDDSSPSVLKLDPHQQIASYGATERVKAFLSVFLPLAQRNDDSMYSRAKEWTNAAGTGNETMTLNMLEAWVKRRLCLSLGQAQGTNMYQEYFPAIFQAFMEVRQVHHGVNTGDIVERSEFRLLVAHLCVCALAVDAFNTIVSSTKPQDEAVGDNNEGAKKLSRTAWSDGYGKVTSHGFVALSSLSNASKDKVMSLYDSMKRSGEVTVGLTDWCNFLKMREVESNTVMGELVKMTAPTQFLDGPPSPSDKAAVVSSAKESKPPSSVEVDLAQIKPAAVAVRETGTAGTTPGNVPDATQRELQDSGATGLCCCCWP